MSHGKTLVLAAIQRVIGQCEASQLVRPDPAVAHEITELQSLEREVRREWPLSERVKSAIDLGPFAAKNIEDWDESLATALMSLDYSLQHDGVLSKGMGMLRKQGAEPTAAARVLVQLSRKRRSSATARRPRRKVEA